MAENTKLKNIIEIFNSKVQKCLANSEEARRGDSINNCLEKALKNEREEFEKDTTILDFSDKENFQLFRQLKNTEFLVQDIQAFITNKDKFSEKYWLRKQGL